jgi:hypothetical protein
MGIDGTAMGYRCACTPLLPCRLSTQLQLVVGCLRQPHLTLLEMIIRTSVADVLWGMGHR